MTLGTRKVPITTPPNIYINGLYKGLMHTKHPIRN
jgi:hypothetical protein